MEYTGKLYGKINRTYFPMIQTAADFDAMKRERDILENKLSEICEPLHEFVEESDLADGTEAGHSVVKVAVQYGRRYRRERDEAREILRRLVQAKDEKEAHGDTLVYRSLKEGLWGAARNAISPENDPSVAVGRERPSTEA